MVSIVQVDMPSRSRLRKPSTISAPAGHSTFGYCKLGLRGVDGSGKFHLPCLSPLFKPVLKGVKAVNFQLITKPGREQPGF